MSSWHVAKDPVSVRVSPASSRTNSDNSLRGHSGDGRNNHHATEVLSKWTIGWQTPLLMTSCYLLSVVIAVGHFLFFKYMNGQQASGPNAILPQAFVTTISNILANAFGFSLRASLAVAFVQHLWHLFRIQAMKVSTIELIFALRTNFFVLFAPVVMKATPVLTLLALVMWMSQIVTSFPPGALNVEIAVREIYTQLRVPTYDAAFMGNGSGLEANRYALLTLTPTPFGFAAGSADSVKDGNLLNRLARQVLVSSKTLASTSPCGVNCSYATTFEAPWFQCNTSKSEYIYPDASNIFEIYAANWSAPLRPSRTARYNGTDTLAKFNSTTLQPLEANGTDIGGPLDTSVRLQQDQTVCVPGRARYVVKHTWSNNILTRNSSFTPIAPLRNLAILTHNQEVGVGGFALPPAPANLDIRFGTDQAQWSPDALELYRDHNYQAIVSALMSHIAGQYLGWLPPKGFAPATGPGNFTSYELAWNDLVVSQNSGKTSSLGAMNGNVVENTLFNNATGKYSAGTPIHPSFNVTPVLLNEYLFNMTTSIMEAYGNWETTTNATITTTTSVYAFSEPLNLIVPYLATLFVAFPFIILGCIALMRNGVSALDNSFIQMLTTTTGSAAIDNAAAGGCLGGGENVPQEFKDLKVKFGEILERNDPMIVKRAAFGTEEEVTMLNRDIRYGIARWF